MPFRLGPMEIAIVLVIILIVFGVGKLPQIGGAIGKSLKEFRKEKDAKTEDVTVESTSVPDKTKA